MLNVLLSAAWMPHGYCLLWQPWLVALHAGPDAVIFLSYAAIPLALVRLLRLRPDLRGYRNLVGLFAAFILLCGITHLFGLVTLWLPIYPVEGLAKLATALVSVATAAVLFPLVPTIAALPSPSELAGANAHLRAEIDNHERTLAALRRKEAELEDQVRARTAELEASNARLGILTRETVHRSKNLLTVVQSIARQTARRAGDLDAFVTAFEGRLGAMSAATDTIMLSGDRATAPLETVIEGQIRHIVETFPGRVDTSGPAIVVRTEAAQLIALAVHELATNAAKHGALATPEGRVALAWKIDGDTLELSWRETGMPEGASDPSRVSGGTGFGRVLLEKAVPAQLGGRATREVVAGGLAYVLTVPRERFVVGDRTAGVTTTETTWLGQGST